MIKTITKQQFREMSIPTIDKENKAIEAKMRVMKKDSHH